MPGVTSATGSCRSTLARPGVRASEVALVDARHGGDEEASRYGQRRTLSTAVHVIRALESIAQDPHGMSAKALARRLGQSLSSAYYVLQSLSAMGLVEPAPGSPGLYTLGPKIAELFHGYAASWLLPNRLEPLLAELRDSAAARSYLATWNGVDVEVTRVLGRRGAAELRDVSAGFRGATHSLALGKVFLAAIPPQDWPDSLKKAQYPAYTETTITSPQRLREELAGVRRQGHAVDVEEFEPNACCVAAPIRDGAGRVLAAVAVSTTLRRFRRDGDVLRAAVCEIAAAASARFEALDPLRKFVMSSPRLERPGAHFEASSAFLPSHHRQRRRGQRSPEPGSRARP